MKSSKILKIFEQYVKKYDMNNSNIKTKYFHSLKTMELARELATTIGVFEEEEILICELIALFHEIGSFDKAANFHIMNDENDTTNETLDILFNKGLLRKITEDTKYDEIIKIVILSYNKKDFPSNTDEKTLHFCRVLKDIHKIDIFRMVINYPYIDLRIDTFPSNMVYNDFKLFQVVNEKLTENNADEVLVILSNIFDFNYKYSFYMIKNNDYISKIVHSLSFNNKNVENFFNQLEKVLNDFIDKKIGLPVK